MKIRVERRMFPPGLEVWTKKKLECGSIELNREKIIKRIGESFYRSILERQIYVEVDKTRSNRMTNKFAYIETCFISLREPIGLRPRPWISIAVEGSTAECITDALCNDLKLRVLWDCLRICNRILADHYIPATSNGFFPVLSGYPAWLVALYAESHDQFVDIIRGDVEELLRFVSTTDSELKTDIPSAKRLEEADVIEPVLVIDDVTSDERK